MCPPASAFPGCPQGRGLSELLLCSQTYRADQQFWAGASRGKGLTGSVCPCTSSCSQPAAPAPSGNTAGPGSVNGGAAQLEPRCFAWGWAKAMDNGGEGLGGVKGRDDRGRRKEQSERNTRRFQDSGDLILVLPACTPNS